jgi:hypothetical protein
MKLLRVAWPVVMALAVAGCAGPPGHAHDAHYAHYAGMAAREIKALSAADVDGLREGRGMGLALAAELNGYPGPLHVLELADRLALTSAQRAATEALHARMQRAAVAAGGELIDAERELDRLFATRTVAPASLTAALDRVARAQAQLRGAHLQAHLAQARILDARQVAMYNRLRGYAAR